MTMARKAGTADPTNLSTKAELGQQGAAPAQPSLGLRGWQWLFLVEGLPAVALGVVTWFWLTDRPETASWLPDDEKAALEAAVPALTRWRGRGRVAGWRYETTWQPVAVPPGRGPAAGTWLLVTSDGVPAGLVDEVRDGLAAHGLSRLRTVSLDAWERPDDDPDDDPYQDVAGIVSLLGCIPVSDAESALGLGSAVTGTVRLIRAATTDVPHARIWTLTRGGSPADGGAPLDAWAWQLFALGRVAGLEYPASWGGVAVRSIR